MTKKTYKLNTTAYVGETWSREPVILKLTIDWDKLARSLADKATRNRSKTTRLNFGVVARVEKETA